MDDTSKTPHPIDVIVGSRVRSARLARGLSQGALAERIGVTFQQVQKYESGANRVSASMLVEIADTLGVTAAGFLQGIGLMARAEGDEPPEAHDLMTIYASLAPPLRKAVLDLARTLSGAASTASGGPAPKDGRTKAHAAP